MENNINSDFDMLRPYEEPLWRFGALAKRHFADAPDLALEDLLGELTGDLTGTAPAAEQAA